ncbi:MAG: hypothetical protein H6745_22640 [Deltaproteobacteria bacterium]|nr:hypothetical protein [Deltaproteobacteria bacterium]
MHAQNPKKTHRPARGALAALAAVVALAALAPACLDAPEYVYGYDLLDLRLSLYRTDMGVHPSQSVLDDPNNPFRYEGVGADTKWLIQSYGNNAAAFYAWATLLARAPSGESQYYAALALQHIAENREVSDVELPFVRDMALAGYTALLDDFPGSVSYDPSGLYSYPLAPLAWQGIQALGGTLPPGWIVVATEGGGTTIIPVASDAEDAVPADPEATP